MGIQINGQTDIISASDGSLTISGANLPTVTNLNATGIVTATSFSGGGSALTGVGSILQVVQASKTDTTSTASQDTFVDLGLSTSITPSSSSNKVLVMVSIGRVCKNNTTIRLCPFRILRDATAIGIGDADGVKLQCNFAISDVPDNNYGSGCAYQYLDSPSTTSSTTYKIQWSGQAGETWYLHRSSDNNNNTDTPNSRQSSHIILMEVAG